MRLLYNAAAHFAAVVGHADVDFAHQKPDPAAFLACLDHLGLREGRFAYIGDHAGDIAFGRNAQAALRALGRTAEVVCVAAAWGGAVLSAYKYPFLLAETAAGRRRKPGGGRFGNKTGQEDRL